MKTLFVGNLPFSTTEQELRDLFSQYGSVDNVQIVTARDTGLPRGFAFVTVDDDSAAAVVEALNGTMFAGRRMKVDETRDDQVSPADKEAADAEEPAERPFRPRRSFRDREDGGFKREDRGEVRPRRSFRDREDGGFKREDRGEFRPRRSFRDREDGGFKREDRGEFRPRRSFRDREEGGFKREDRGNFRARRPFRRENSDFQD